MHSFINWCSNTCHSSLSFLRAVRERVAQLSVVLLAYSIQLEDDMWWCTTSPYTTVSRVAINFWLPNCPRVCVDLCQQTGVENSPLTQSASYYWCSGLSQGQRILPLDKLVCEHADRFIVFHAIGRGLSSPLLLSAMVG